LGCSVSLFASATLNARIIISATVYWGVLPFVQLVSIIAVCWTDRRHISLARTIDTFFAGYAPWFIYLIGLAVIWSFLMPSDKPLVSTISAACLYAGALIAALWSAYIDFCFFRFALQRTPVKAARDLLLQRLLSWGVIVLILGAPTVWSE